MGRACKDPRTARLSGRARGGGGGVDCPVFDEALLFQFRRRARPALASGPSRRRRADGAAASSIFQPRALRRRWAVGAASRPSASASRGSHRGGPARTAGPGPDPASPSGLGPRGYAAGRRRRGVDTGTRDSTGYGDRSGSFVCSCTTPSRSCFFCSFSSCCCSRRHRPGPTDRGASPPPPPRACGPSCSTS